MKWIFPIENCSGIPINFHPGAFGFKRRKNFHTGIDLYTNYHEPVYPCEIGEVVKIFQFTGASLGMDWWLDTWAVMVEGKTGVINYGEIQPNPELKVGDCVDGSTLIGNVIPVIKEGRERPDIEGHSRNMLHLELYTHGSREWAHWHPCRDKNLLDPTPYIIDSIGGPRNFLSWYNFDGKEAG